jgi:hypothetical protein
MATLHYGNSEIEITDDEARSLLDGDAQRLYGPGIIQSATADGGLVTIVTGPGIPIWIDQRRDPARDASPRR